MSTGTILILVFAVAMIAMHLRGHSSHGGQGHHGPGGHSGHAAGHGGGCGGSHAANSEAISASKAPNVRVGESADPPADSTPHPGPERG